MRYEFQALEEIAWAAATAGGLALLQVLVTFDPAEIADWRLWAVALGGGVIRAAAGRAIEVATRRRVTA